MMVMRELRVLSNVLCASSRAKSILSIWARLSGLAVTGLILGLALTPAVIVLVLVLSVVFVVPSPPAALLLRSHCLRYRLGPSAGDLSSTAGGWVRLG